MASRRGGRVRVGVSGWSYDQWEGDFYPDDLPKRDRLEYAARQFDTLEINGSFYSLLSPDSYEGYRRTAPAGFVYAVKGSQFITHSRKLKDVKTPVANFFASGVLRLEEKLGPVLWQFPELEFEHERVDEFLELLPNGTEQASRLARQHDDNVSGKASMKVGSRRLRVLRQRSEGLRSQGRPAAGGAPPHEQLRTHRHGRHERHDI